METQSSPARCASTNQCISLPGLLLERFWHCFGTERHSAPLDLIVQLLHASATNVLPINTHHLDNRRQRSALEHGFGGATYDALGERIDLSPYVKMLNINLRTTAHDAVQTAKIAVDMTGERVLKLEVLQPQLRHSRDDDVLEAARRLMTWEPSLVVLPLISCCLDTAKAAIDAGCPLLRVMGSPISSGNGIADAAAFAEICSLPTPVVRDGGVGKTTDIDRAVALGAGGVLVNSVLFDSGRAPVGVMAEFVAAARRAFELSFTG
jgi:thiazole synthase